jgi:hypothetical protein
MHSSTVKAFLQVGAEGATCFHATELILAFDAPDYILKHVCRIFAAWLL